MIPDATIKKIFLKVTPPPDMISELHNHIHRRANNEKPMTLPILIPLYRIKSRRLWQEFQ